MGVGSVTNVSQPLHNNEPNKRTETMMDKTEVQKDIVLHNDRVINKDQIKTVVSKLNQIIEPLRTDLKFQYHEKLNEYYVAVVNPLTSEVIKEIPPKKMLDMYAEMAELMGILIDEKI